MTDYLTIALTLGQVIAEVAKTLGFGLSIAAPIYLTTLAFGRREVRA